MPMPDITTINCEIRAAALLGKTETEARRLGENRFIELTGLERYVAQVYVHNLAVYDVLQDEIEHKQAMQHQACHTMEVLLSVVPVN